jgi:hypothetical protein
MSSKNIVGGQRSGQSETSLRDLQNRKSRVEPCIAHFLPFRCHLLMGFSRFAESR